MTSPHRPRRGTLGAAAHAPGHGERFEDLLCTPRVRIEQILSSASPDRTPYDQPHDEWVLLLDGGAVLDVAGERMILRPGDWVWLPARTPHRVLGTDQGTRWLAVHLTPADG